MPSDAGEHPGSGDSARGVRDLRLEDGDSPTPGVGRHAASATASLKELGTGPRGTVYAVEGAEVPLAVKVFHPGVHLDHGVLQRFLKGSPEQLRHPNLPLLETIERSAEGAVLCTMPFLGGDSMEETLGDLRRGASTRPSLGPLAVGPNGETSPRFPQQAAELLAEVAEGLQQAHAAGIVHGRITPRNLIFSATGRLVLTDFGARPQDAQIPSSRAQLNYRAPETLTPPGKRAPGGALPAADVYSLGVILYEALGRRAPFEGETAAHARKAIVTGRALALPAHARGAVLPRELRLCVEKAMALAPEKRYADAGALAADLRRFLRNQTPEAVAEGDSGLKKTAAAARSALLEDWGFKLDVRSSLRRVAACLALIAVVGLAFWGGRRSASPEALGPAAQGPAAQGPAALEPAALAGPAALPPTAATPPRAEPATALPVPAVVGRARDEAPGEPADAAGSSDPARVARAAYVARPPTFSARAPARPSTSARSVLEVADIRATALFEDTDLLLEKLGIGPELPPVVLSAEAALALRETLERFVLLDPEGASSARHFLCGWDLETCERLDGVTQGAPPPSKDAFVPVPPNLVVEVVADAPSGFTASWVRGRALSDPEHLLATLPHLQRRDELLPELLPALAAVDTPRALRAIEDITRRNHGAAGFLGLELLERAGSSAALVDIAAGAHPLALRQAALEHLARGFTGEHFPRLTSLAVASPEPSIRHGAFRILSATTSADAARLVLSTVDDFELRALSLDWLQTLPTAIAAPLCAELLGHARDDVRHTAIAILSEGCHPELLWSISLRLFHQRTATRQAARSVLSAQRREGCFRLRAGAWRPPAWKTKLEDALNSAGEYLEKARRHAARTLRLHPLRPSPKRAVDPEQARASVPLFLQDPLRREDRLIPRWQPRWIADLETTAAAWMTPRPLLAHLDPEDVKLFPLPLRRNPREAPHGHTVDVHLWDLGAFGEEDSEWLVPTLD